MRSARARRRRRRQGWAKCPSCKETLYATLEEGQSIVCYLCGHSWDTVDCCWQCGRPWGDMKVKKERRKRRASSRTIRVKVRA